VAFFLSVCAWNIQNDNTSRLFSHFVSICNYLYNQLYIYVHQKLSYIMWVIFIRVTIVILYDFWLIIYPSVFKLIWLRWLGRSVVARHRVQTGACLYCGLENLC
jgi:hypothetical protein